MNKLYEAIKNKDVNSIKELMVKYNLKLDGNKLIPNDKQETLAQAEYWDVQQYLRKILLNSLYGALLNPYCRFFDKRIGQSVTLTGRCITKHMGSKINEILTGEYNHMGDAVVYGDSVVGETIVETNYGPMKIVDLFEQCRIRWAASHDEERLYSVDKYFKVLTYNPETKENYYSDIDYVYKHDTDKDMWEIEDDYGNKVIVTEDHSIMVERSGLLIEVKPAELLESDRLISLK